MTTRTFTVSRPALFAAALALLLLAPGGARAQQAPAPAGASAQAPAPKDIALTAAERQRYVGTYQLNLPNGARSFRVYEEKGALHGQPEGGHSARMLYQGDHTFRPDHDPTMSVTFSLVDGRATGFRVTQPGGETFEAVRASQ